MSVAFDLRLVAYNPLGTRIGVLPDQGFTITATANGPTLTATVSRKVLGQLGVLGKDVELAVESWRQGKQEWTEGRDSRFVVSLQQYDDRDPAGIVTITGVGLLAFLLGAAALAGVTYYSRTDAVTEAAISGTISVSGTTFTWSGNPVGNGDRIKIVNNSKAKKINQGSTYYVRDLSGNDFHLAGTPTGAPINAGSSTGITVQRVVTRLTIPDHKFTRSQAVRTTAGGNTGLSDSTTYYVVNPSPNTIQLATAPGGIPIDLQQGSYAIGTVYTDVDGQRTFNNAHPGTIMSTAFLEARDRGWGVNPSDSSQQLTHSWTVSADSTGAAWVSMAADPSTPGTSISFQPGTPATQMLSFLLTNQYAEWYSVGRVMGLVNYGTGNDHTVDRTPPVRIGRTASQVPVTVDLTGERNSYTVRGYGAVFVQSQAGTIGPWGVLEEYQTAAGMTSRATAVKVASQNISANSSGQMGYVVVENAQEADFLPSLDFSRGDWVAVQAGSDAWSRLRVVEWSYAKAANGSIVATTTLAYVKRATVAKIAHTQAAVTSGISSASGTTGPATESDNRKASAPLGLSVSQVGAFAVDGSATSLPTATWTAASTDIDGNPINPASYEVWLRESGQAAGHVVGATPATVMDLPALPSGRTYEVSVRAASDAGQWGELSPEVEFVTVYPTMVPNPPTAPTFSTDHGTVTVRWDGNLVDPTLGVEAPEAGFAYTQVWRSDTQTGTYVPVGSNMGHAGGIVDGNVAVGSTYWYALAASNTVGVVSPLSTPASVVVAGVDLGSLTQDLQNTISDLQTQAGNAGKIVYSATAPDSTLQVASTLWFDESAAGAAIPKQWNGSAWVAVALGSGALGAGSVVATTIAAGAVNTAALAAGSITSPKIGAGQVTADKIAANTITANQIAAHAINADTIATGAISADKLDLGTVPQGTPTDRVPMPLTQQSFWALALAGAPNIGPTRTAAVTATGITLTPTSTNSSYTRVTARTRVPASGKIALSGLSTGSNAVFKVWTFTSPADLTGTVTIVPLTPAPTQVVLAAGAYDYQIEINDPAAAAAETIEAAHVFEVIGSGGTGQAAELSPSGLRLFDNGGNLALDLTTSSAQYFRVLDNSSGDSVQVAAVDQTGDAQFLGDVQVGGALTIASQLLTDPNDPEGLLNAAPNGSMWDPSVVPLLDRLGRGPIYDVTWPSQDGSVVSTSAQYQRIAQDQFTLENGRSYQFTLQDGGLQATAPNVNAYLELQINTVPNTSPLSGTVIMRSVIFATKSGYWAMPPVIFAASTGAGIDTANRLLPAGVPLYWQLNTNLSSTPSSSWTWNEFGGTRGLTVIDIGSSRLTRPVSGADALADVHDYTSTGSSSGTTSTGTTATSKTVTFTAKSSRTWNNGGSTIVTGSSQYTNGASMYYGTGVTDMGSWFGQFRDSGGHSLSSVLSGKTVTGATLKVHCNYTYSSTGSTVKFGTGSMDTAPSTIGTPSNNVWSSSVSAGSTKSVSLNSTIRAGLASGGVESFVIGVGSGHAGAYSIFNGASQSSPPTLVVTFH